MSEINIDNFEDGQYEADDSMYTDEDNARINERIEKIIRKNTEKHKAKTKPMNFKNLTLDKGCLSPYSSWLIWPDPVLVKNVEELINSNNLDEAWNITMGQF